MRLVRLRPTTIRLRVAQPGHLDSSSSVHVHQIPFSFGVLSSLRHHSTTYRKPNQQMYTKAVSDIVLQLKSTPNQSLPLLKVLKLSSKQTQHCIIESGKGLEGFVREYAVGVLQLSKEKGGPMVSLVVEKQSSNGVGDDAHDNASSPSSSSSTSNVASISQEEMYERFSIPERFQVPPAPQVCQTSGFVEAEKIVIPLLQEDKEGKNDILYQHLKLLMIPKMYYTLGDLFSYFFKEEAGATSSLASSSSPASEQQLASASDPSCYTLSQLDQYFLQRPHLYYKAKTLSGGNYYCLKAGWRRPDEPPKFCLGPTLAASSASESKGLRNALDGPVERKIHVESVMEVMWHIPVKFCHFSRLRIPDPVRKKQIGPTTFILAWLARLPQYFDLVYPHPLGIVVRRSPLWHPAEVGMTREAAVEYVQKQLVETKIANGQPPVLQRIRTVLKP